MNIIDLELDNGFYCEPKNHLVSLVSATIKITLMSEVSANITEPMFSFCFRFQKLKLTDLLKLKSEYLILTFSGLL